MEQEADHSSRNMTQVSAAEEQEEGEHDTHTLTHACTQRGENSLADLARALERAILLLQHLGGNGGSHKSLSLSLLLLPRLCLPLPVAPTLSLLSLWSLTHTHTFTHAHVSSMAAPPIQVNRCVPAQTSTQQRRTGPTCSLHSLFEHSSLWARPIMRHSCFCVDAAFLPGSERTRLQWWTKSKYKDKQIVILHPVNNVSPLLLKKNNDFAQLYHQTQADGAKL